MEDLWKRLVIDHWQRLESREGDVALENGGTPTDAPVLTLLLGPSGSGKTAALVDQAALLVRKGVSARRTLYADLADPRLPADLRRDHLAALIESFLILAPGSRREPFYLLLDNLGIIEDWPVLARALADTYAVRIWASAADATWLDSTAQARLSFSHEVIPLTGRPLQSLLRSFIAAQAAAGSADPVRGALDRLFCGEESPEGAVYAAQRRHDVANGCARDAARFIPGTPLALIRRTAALLLGQSGTAPSLSALQRQLESEGLSTTRATLTTVAEALQRAQLIVRPHEFGGDPRDNTRAARLVVARDIGSAQAFATSPLRGAPLVISVVASVLCSQGREGQLRQVRPDRGRGLFIAWGNDEAAGPEGLVAVDGAQNDARPGPRSAFVRGAEAVMERWGHRRLTVITPSAPWVTHCSQGILEGVPLGQWVLDQAGLLR